MMKKYERPVIIMNSDLAEGVYAASGAGAGGTTNNGPKCDSIYMKGVWQAQDTSSWWNNGVETKRGYKAQFACLGCPANTANGCGLLTHYVDSGNASSYDVDNGNRKPTWEKKGYGPDDIVSDWSCG